MKNNKGFSLVELIVVIAIMAILAAVAVVGVSVYIPKAQQANDKQLISDIEYMLNLAYQGGDLTTNGYIIISADGAEVNEDNAEIIAILENAYGEKWYEEVALQYDGWIGMTSDQAFAQAYQNSSFNGKEDALITQLGSVTNTLKDALASNAGLVGTSFTGYLTENKIDTTSSQAVSNAAILYAADTIGNLDATKTAAVNSAFANFYNPEHASYGQVTDLTNALRNELGTFGAVAALYAHGEAFGQYVDSNDASDDSDLLENFHNIDMSTVEEPEDALNQVAGNLGTLIMTAQTNESIRPLTDKYISDAQYSKDVVAYLESMKQIDANADKFMGKLGEAGCYTDGTAGALLQAAVSAGSMNVTCEDGEVAIWITDGKVNNTVFGIQD